MGVIRHSVAMVRQGGSPVCWAACAMMILQHKRGQSLGFDHMGFHDPRLTSVTNVQYMTEVESKLRSWGFTVKASDDISMGVASRQSEMNENMGGVHATMRTVVRRTPTYTIADKIEVLLRRWGPVILFHHCGAFSYGPGVTTPTTGFHAVVITGIDTGRGGMFFNNPWGQRDVPTTISSIENAVRRWESSGSNPAFAYFP